MNERSRAQSKRTVGLFYHQGGFTLIELMITVVVIGILVGIAVPVFLDSRHRADKVTADYNYKVGCQAVDHVWLKLIQQDDYTYRDSLPPGGLKAPAVVNAEYMSIMAPKMKWSEVLVTGNHARLGNNGVYKNGELIKPVLGQERFNWENLYGTVGIIYNAVWLDGRWQNNTNAVQNYEYLTVVVMNQQGEVLYTTYHQGVPIEVGSFDWDDGYGYPQ